MKNAISIGLILIAILIAALTFVFKKEAAARYESNLKQMYHLAKLRANARTIHAAEQIYFNDKKYLVKTTQLPFPQDAVKVHRLAFDGQEPYLEYQDNKGNLVIQRYTWRGEPRKERFILNNQ